MFAAGLSKSFSLATLAGLDGGKGDEAALSALLTIMRGFLWIAQPKACGSCQAESLQIGREGVMVRGASS